MPVLFVLTCQVTQVCLFPGSVGRISQSKSKQEETALKDMHFEALEIFSGSEVLLYLLTVSKGSLWGPSQAFDLLFLF